MKYLKTLLLSLAVSALGLTSTYAVPGVQIAITGGKGSALNITFVNGVSFTTTAYHDSGIPAIVLSGLYSGSTGNGVSKSLNNFSYTINDGPDNYPYAPELFDIGATAAFTSGDFLINFNQYMPIGTVFSITAGTTLTTTTAWASDPSTYNSSFQIYLADDSSGVHLSNTLSGLATLPASAVPEPSTYALFAGAAVLGLVAFKRRRSA